MARRVDIEALVTQHGVGGLARKVGVHVRTIERWRHDGVDPSPLAVEKLKGLAAEARPDIPRSRSLLPQRQPIDLDPDAHGGIVPARRP